MIFNIRSWADARAAAYTLLPVITSFLVSYGVLDDQKAALWAGLVTAVLGPVVAAFMARQVNAWRAGLYAILAAGQALFIGYGLISPDQLDAWMPLITTLIGGAAGSVSVANTDTTPAVPQPSWSLHGHGKHAADG